MAIHREFLQFLKEYNIVALAAAFIMGVATKDLVNSLVNNIIMPFVNPFIPKGDWKTATFALGPVNIGYGPFLASLLNFTILALVIFFIAKKILKEEHVKKK